MNIKKTILAGALAIVCAMPSFAQQEAKPTFNPYWFLQLQGGAQYTLGEADFGDLISPNVAGSLGYQFNPLFGMRLNVDAWQSKGGWSNPAQTFKWNYVAADVDFMLNLSNLLCGWNPTRTLSFYGFLGGGLNHAWSNDDANNLKTHNNYKLEYLWDGSKNSLVGRGGLGVNIRLSDAVDFNIEGNANVLTDHYNSKKAGNADWYFNALAGLTIKLGKGYIAPVAPVVEETPAPVEEAKPIVKEEPKPEVIEAMRRDIFFAINKTVVRDSEKSKIDDLVQYMNKYPNSKVVVTGYADVDTGTAKINLNLSKGRAAAVVDALKAAGIDESRISSDFKGDTVQPFNTAAENRVSICIAQ